MKAKDNLQKIVRYESAHLNRPGKIKLDRNERVYEWNQEVFNGLQKVLTQEVFMSYPEIAPVYEKLAAHLGVEREMLLLCHASDAGLKTVFDVYVGKGDEAVILKPTYAMYPVYVQIVGAVGVEVSFREDLSLPMEDILNAITKKTKLVCLPNPNQPIERVFTDEEVERVLGLSKEMDFLVVMDEAYHYFHKNTALGYLKNNPNLIISRTFSKAFGLAGLRAGYLVANKERIVDLRKVKPISEINGIAARTIEYFLDRFDVVEEHVKTVDDGRKYVIDRAKDLGIKTHGYAGNSILLECESADKVTKIVETAMENNILVKGPFEEPANRHLRITLGPISIMERVMKIVGDVVQ